MPVTATRASFPEPDVSVRDRTAELPGRDKSAHAYAGRVGRARVPPDPGPIDLSRWPLVGRDDELALATAALADHGSVVLTGSAGVGKTRLARELLASLPNARTEWVAATQAAASVPLGPVAHLVPADVLGQGRDATLRGIVGALQAENDGGRLLLGVDDAHLLDDASAA